MRILLWASGKAPVLDDTRLFGGREGPKRENTTTPSIPTQRVTAITEVHSHEHIDTAFPTFLCLLFPARRLLRYWRFRDTSSSPLSYKFPYRFRLRFYGYFSSYTRAFPGVACTGAFVCSEDISVHISARQALFYMQIFRAWAAFAIERCA